MIIYLLAWYLGSSVRFGAIQLQKEAIASSELRIQTGSLRSRGKKSHVQCNYHYLKPFQQNIFSQENSFAEMETSHKSIPTSLKCSCEREVKVSHFNKCQNISERQLLGFF